MSLDDRSFKTYEAYDVGSIEIDISPENCRLFGFVPGERFKGIGDDIGIIHGEVIGVAPCPNCNEERCVLWVRIDGNKKIQHIGLSDGLVLLKVAA